MATIFDSAALYCGSEEVKMEKVKMRDRDLKRKPVVRFLVSILQVGGAVLALESLSPSHSFLKNNIFC